MEALKDQTLTSDDTAESITRVGRFICELYRLELDLDGHDYLVSPDLARSLLPEPCPRTGILAIEEEGELQLGVYVDPDDQANLFALVEETSHLVCLAWHAANDLPVSQLVLEFQSEVDRFLYFSHDSGHLSFSCFEAGRLCEWVDRNHEDRYEIARIHAHRYCRALVQRFGPRGDTAGLARELRRFYRSSPAMKLAS